jgi:hypothetical protein
MLRGSSSSIPDLSRYDPPDTMGALGAAGTDAGACAGGCRLPGLPLPAEEPPPAEASPPAEDCDCPGGVLAPADEPPALTVRPWKVCAATREMRPENATAATISQRLTREMSASP